MMGVHDGEKALVSGIWTEVNHDFCAGSYGGSDFDVEENFDVGVVRVEGIGSGIVFAATGNEAVVTLGGVMPRPAKYLLSSSLRKAAPEFEDGDGLACSGEIGRKIVKRLRLVAG